MILAVSSGRPARWGRRLIVGGTAALTLALCVIPSPSAMAATVPTPQAEPAAATACATATPTVAEPASTVSPGSSTPQPGVFDGVALSAAQVGAAQTVVAMGRQMGVTRRGVRLALAVALQESSLNPVLVTGTDVGLFQQKTADLSGLYTQYNRADAAGASQMFFEQLLVRDPGYDSDPRADWEIGQVVQSSHVGRNVLQWFGVSQALLSKLYPVPAADAAVSGLAIGSALDTLDSGAGAPIASSTPSAPAAQVVTLRASRFVAGPALRQAGLAFQAVTDPVTDPTGTATVDSTIGATGTSATVTTTGTTGATGPSGTTVTTGTTGTSVTTVATTTGATGTSVTTGPSSPTTTTTGSTDSSSTTTGSTDTGTTGTISTTGTSGPTTGSRPTGPTTPATRTSSGPQPSTTATSPRTTATPTSPRTTAQPTAPKTTPRPTATTTKPAPSSTAAKPTGPKATGKKTDPLGHDSPPVVDTPSTPVPTGTGDDPQVGPDAPGIVGPGAGSVADGSANNCGAGAELRSTAFDPGLIISDQVFYNSHALTAAQIRAFLDAEGSGCVSAECLKNLRVTTPTLPADRYCATYQGGRNEDVATVLAKLSVACGINPQVMLVTLQKESALVTRTDVTAASYNAAYGWHCPDSGPGGSANCDPAYAGFFNQAAGMAKQWSRYRVDPGKYNYRAGQTVNILWNVAETGCGGSFVHIRNTATASLYDYTPYQPDAASLAAYPGVGDKCSSYGNRNFFFLFQKWFGQTGGGAAADVQLNGVSVTIPDAATVAPEARGKTITAPNAAVAAGLAAGFAAIGLPYVYGGGTNGGGADQGCARAGGASNSCQGIVGFDCSGLTGYVLSQAGFHIPDNSWAQRGAGTSVPWTQGRPGDIIGYQGHVAVYLGLIGGVPYLLEAPTVGMFVQIRPVYYSNDGVAVDPVLHRYWS